MPVLPNETVTLPPMLMSPAFSKRSIYREVGSGFRWLEIRLCRDGDLSPELTTTWSADRQGKPLRYVHEDGNHAVAVRRTRQRIDPGTAVYSVARWLYRSEARNRASEVAVAAARYILDVGRKLEVGDQSADQQ